MQPETRNPKPGTRNPEPGTRNKEQGTKNQEPGTRNNLMEDIDKICEENRQEMDKIKSALAVYLANLRCRNQPEYMTSKEVMAFLRITPLTLFRYRHEGILQGYKVKNKYRYKFKEVYGLVKGVERGHIMSLEA